MDRKAAVQEAIRLAQSKPRPPLCAPILAIPASEIRAMVGGGSSKRRKQAAPPSSTSSAAAAQPLSPTAAPASRPPQRRTAAVDSPELLRLVGECVAADDFRPAIRVVGQLFSSLEVLGESFLPPAAAPAEECKDADEDGDVQMSGKTSSPSALVAAATSATAAPTKTDCQVDLVGLEEAARTITNTPALCNALHNALTALAPSHHVARAALDPTPQRLRPWLLLLLASPFWNNPDFYGHLKRLLECVKQLPRPAQEQLVAWCSRLGVRGIEPILTYLQQLITVKLLEERRSADIPTEVWLAAYTVQLLFSANVELETRQLTQEHRPTLDVLPVDAFYNPIINEEYNNMEADYHHWRQGRQAFYQYPSLLDAANKSALLRVEALYIMRQHYHQNMQRHIREFGIFVQPPNPRLVLHVEREHLLQTTLFGLQDVPMEDFKKPLQIQFEGEEGVDQGGPKKEFFSLLIHQLFDQAFGLFVHDPNTRLFWINQDSLPDMDGEFRLIGILFGLAIFNGVILDVHFPQVMFKKLLMQPTGFADLQQSHPELHNSFTKLMQAEEDVSEWGMCFSASYETVFGESKEIDLRPGGSEIGVTLANREEFVTLYVDWILNKSIERQFNAFLQGFHQVCDGAMLRTLRPPELELLVCGSSKLEFSELREGTRWEDGYTGKEEICEWLWEILLAMDEKDQKRFLAFTTGSDRTPINGLASLGLVISRHGGDSETLPSSHTCFNHLLLPQYNSKEKLQQKLSIALANAQGFGLL